MLSVNFDTLFSGKIFFLNSADSIIRCVQNYLQRIERIFFSFRVQVTEVLPYVVFQTLTSALPTPVYMVAGVSILKAHSFVSAQRDGRGKYVILVGIVFCHV